MYTVHCVCDILRCKLGRKLKAYIVRFLPLHDALLMQYILWPSITSQYCVKTAKHIITQAMP